MTSVKKLIEVVEAMGYISIFECKDDNDNGMYVAKADNDTDVRVYFDEDFDSWVVSFEGDGISYLHEFNTEAILIEFDKM